MTHAYNAYDGGTNVSTGGYVYHGTGVTGLAGGADNDLGIAGIAYEATIWPVQADSGPGPFLGGNAWARAIDWVRTTDSGGMRKVIILEVQTGSFGNYEMVPSVNAAIRTAIAHGVVVCVAAGNGNRDAGIDDQGNPIPPTGSILVGATEYHATENRRASFSNFGAPVVVCAPGDSSHDLTCNNTADNAYRNGFGGTSGATPKVAGTVALMLDVNPNLTHEQIRTILNTTGTAVVTAPGKPVGTFLNAEAAVREALRRTGGRLEVFARGSDKALWHKWQTAPNNGWSTWASLGGWVNQPVVTRNADGRLEGLCHRQ
ncbi:S8 family peptidase [Nitrospira sp. Nam80]